MEIATENQDVLVISEKGYGKRTPVDEYRLTNRGGKGVRTINITDKNGSIVAFKTVTGNEDVMIITNTGMVIRLGIEKISQMSRVTQGVRLINLKENQLVSSVAIVEKETEENEDINNKEDAIQ